MKKPLATLALLTSIAIGVAETTEEDARILHEVCSIPILEGLTLRGHLTLSWKTEGPENFPTTVTITNPFEEEITVFRCGDIPSLGGVDQVVLEYYDPILSKWCIPRQRSPYVNFGRDRTRLQKGERTQLDLPARFWQGLREHPASNLKSFRLRVAFDLGGVALRTDEFQWKPANRVAGGI